MKSVYYIYRHAAVGYLEHHRTTAVEISVPLMMALNCITLKFKQACAIDFVMKCPNCSKQLLN